MLPAQQGKVREAVVVRTSSPTVPILEVPVRGEIEGPYSVEPGILSFGLLVPGQSATRKLSIRRKDGQSFSVRSDVDMATTVNIKPQGEVSVQDGRPFARIWAIEVVERASANKGFWRRQLTFVATTGSG